MTTQLRVIGSHAVSDIKIRHLDSPGHDDADCLVAWYNWELGDEFAFVNVLFTTEGSISSLPECPELSRYTQEVIPGLRRRYMSVLSFQGLLSRLGYLFHRRRMP